MQLLGVWEDSGLRCVVRALFARKNTFIAKRPSQVAACMFSFAWYTAVDGLLMVAFLSVKTVDGWHC